MGRLFQRDSRTSTTLVEGLRDPGNAKAWTRFDDLFRETIYRFARSRGLRHEDAEDAVQNTIAACAHAYKTYDRTIGALHSWVFRIAQNKIIDLQRARPQEVVSADGSGTRILNTVPDPHAERSWNTEHRKTMLRKCLEPVRREFSAQIILAFELYALKGEDATEVARKLGVQRNVVYVWKNRVLARMRQRRSELEAILQGLA